MMERTPSRTATLYDVARLANVSASTVSRAFNHTALVDSVTLGLVMDAAEKLRYVPNGGARLLRKGGQSRTVGLVIPTLQYSWFANTAEGLQMALASQGYTLLIASSDGNEATERDAVLSMIERGIDGLALVGIQHDPEVLALLNGHRIPYVITWSYDPVLPSVGFDHQRAMAVVVGHLLELGHRKFAVVAGLRDSNDRIRARVAGTRNALAAHGIDLPAHLVFDGLSRVEDGRDAFGKLMALAPETTAVVCVNDMLAAGVILEARSRGLSVPGHISVTGFSDMDIASVIDPAVTTVRVPAREMGRLAAEHLMHRAAAGGELPHVELPTEIIVRCSTGPVRRVT